MEWSLAEAQPAVDAQFPLSGEWTVARAGHGTDAFGQRYAFDFIRCDGRAGAHIHPASSIRWVLVGGRTHACYGWGQPVHAALGGVVVTAVDGASERHWIHPIRETFAALRTMAGFSVSRRRIGPARLAGNHVIVRSGEICALYAHLAPESVAVTAGESIDPGDVLGRVGHTGNSTAPHLHFQLMDSPDPLIARGVPCRFARYLTESDGEWRQVERSVPSRFERVRFDVADS